MTSRIKQTNRSPLQRCESALRRLEARMTRVETRMTRVETEAHGMVEDARRLADRWELMLLEDRGDFGGSGVLSHPTRFHIRHGRRDQSSREPDCFESW